RNMLHLAALVNAHRCLAKLSGAGQDVSQHQAMRSQQMVDVVCFKVLQGFIGGNCALHSARWLG
ncbi:MAG: hypothetical protein QMB92_08850, partial [Thiopseudomonas sp.]